MPYTPTTWVGGDVISAERLNKIEQGIQNLGNGGSNTLVVNCFYKSVYDDWYDLDQTCRTIYNAVLAGKNVVIVFWNDDDTVYGIDQVVWIDQINNLENNQTNKGIGTKEYDFYTSNPDGYPVIYWYA